MNLWSCHLPSAEVKAEEMDVAAAVVIDCWSWKASSKIMFVNPMLSRCQ